MLAISVENLSKKFQLGTLNRAAFMEELRAKLARLSRRRGEVKGKRESERANGLISDSTPHSPSSLSPSSSSPSHLHSPLSTSRDFWALRDINFEIKEGETVGIIGRNGAGKSTLLKILSRITAPTTGRARIKGRVGSLLEVGTGFHPELTGRENVYLYGSILGMRRNELDRKFDDIVSFAEVEKFIDTPVKHYSSGMMVRLAFTVASFLEPEILIVDEALSVGDAAFQRKCRKRMDSLIAEGRTLLLVSHAGRLLEEVCKRVLYLRDGNLVYDGEATRALALYYSSYSSEGSSSVDLPDFSTGEVVFERGNEPGDEVVKVTACRLVDSHGTCISHAVSTAEMRFELDFRVQRKGYLLRPAAYLSDDIGNIIFWTCDTSNTLRLNELKPGKYRASFSIPGDLLAPGVFTFSAGVGSADANGTPHALATNALRVTITEDLSGNSLRGSYTGPLPGSLRPRLAWKTVDLGS